MLSYLFLGLAALVIICALLPMRIKTKYCRGDGKHVLHIELDIAYFLHLQKTYPINDLLRQHKVPAVPNNQQDAVASMLQAWQTLRQKWQFIRTYYLILRRAIHYLLAHLQWEKLQWETIFGTDDPAVTGFATGLIWQAKYTILGLLAPRLHYHRAHPLIKVQPDFVTPQLNIYFESIFSLRVGNIMVVLLKAITACGKILWQKYSTGGWPLAKAFLNSLLTGSGRELRGGEKA